MEDRIRTLHDRAPGAKQEASATTTLDVADVLRTALALIRARPALLIGVAVACALPMFVFTTWGMPYVYTLSHTFRPWRSGDDLLVRSLLSAGINAGVLIVIAVLTSSFRTTVATLAVIDPRMTTRDVLAVARSRWFAVICTDFVALVLVGLGLVFLVAPGVYLAIELTFATTVAAHQHRGAVASMKRGVEVIGAERGAMVMLYAAVFTPHVLLCVARLVVENAGDVAAAFTAGDAAMFIVGGALYVATTLLSAVATAVAYARLAGPFAPPVSESVDVFA